MYEGYVDSRDEDNAAKQKRIQVYYAYDTI